MSLGKKFKRAFARKFNEDSGWNFLAGLILVAGNSFGVGVLVHEENAEQPPTPVTIAEERKFQAGLTQVESLAAKSQSYDGKITQLERAITRGQNVEANRQELSSIKLEQAKQKIALDETSDNLRYYMLVQSNVPEARYDEIMDAFNDKNKKILGLTSIDETYEMTNYRDECRLDLKKKDTGQMSVREQVKDVATCAAEAHQSNGGLVFLSSVIGAPLGSLALGSILLGIGGTFSRRWREEINQEEYAKKKKQREEEEARRAKEAPLPESTPEPAPAPKPRPTPKLRLD